MTEDIPPFELSSYTSGTKPECSQVQPGTTKHKFGLNKLVKPQRSGLMDYNEMLAIQNRQVNFLPFGVRGQQDKLYIFNQAGGHVVVYVRATCCAQPSKWPLLGHFRPSGQHLYTQTSVSATVLLGQHTVRVLNEDQESKQVFFFFVLTQVKLSFAMTSRSH